MSVLTQSSERLVAGSSVAATPAAALQRARTRAMYATTAITLVATGLLVDLLLVGHFDGDQVWGPITAAMAAGTGALSLLVLFVRGRNRAVRYALIATWLTVAFFGFGGYNSHRLPVPDGTVESRPRPPLAPLMFTGIGLAGAYVLRSGTKGK